MYQFTEIEKHILDGLVSLEWHQVMLSNLIIKKVNRAQIKINPEKTTATMILHHYMGDSDDNKKLYEKVYRDNMELLCSTINLIKYLKKNHLIYDYGIFSEENLSNEFNLGFHPEPATGGVQWEIEDKNLIVSLIFFSRRVFIPTSDLKCIVKNKYRTYDEVKFRKQMIATWVSIAIAFLVGLIK
jgi:hypothetical protein